MKKIMSIGVLLFFFVLISPVYSQEKSDKNKGASQQAYEHANENAIFNRISDWFATLGKSKEEKEKIIKERHRKREQKRLEKEAIKAEKEKEKLKKQVKKEKENTENVMNTQKMQDQNIPTSISVPSRARGSFGKPKGKGRGR